MVVIFRISMLQSPRNVYSDLCILQKISKLRLVKCNITQGLRRHYIKTNDPKIEIFVMLKSQEKEDTYKIVSFVKHALRVRSFILQE
jgi:hypothetical protein